MGIADDRRGKAPVGELDNNVGIGCGWLSEGVGSRLGEQKDEVQRER